MVVFWAGSWEVVMGGAAGSSEEATSQEQLLCTRRAAHPHSAKARRNLAPLALNPPRSEAL
jgi:hypothetical protein